MAGYPQKVYSKHAASRFVYKPLGVCGANRHAAARTLVKWHLHTLARSPLIQNWGPIVTVRKGVGRLRVNLCDLCQPFPESARAEDLEGTFP
jgi:hypothetical protein